MKESWWIYAPERHPWGGLKIAHFSKPMNSDNIIVIIMGETDPRRIGVRYWNDIEEREGWVKVKQATLPTRAEIDAALDAKLREIAAKITDEAGFDSSGLQQTLTNHVTDNGDDDEQS